ncbi:MAG: class I SAM-dependent DNA methyltransferase [Candidatus Hodarchaeota archaeon]
MKAFDKYSSFYNIMYQDKDYVKEADYIDKIIRHYQPSTKSILDLGCGTGQHAKLLVQKGYKVHGVDTSKTMIEEAKRIESHPSLWFSIGDVRAIQLKESFDVVISLFHVISYQTGNDDLQKVFSTAYNHLKDGGLFIFDCWYGPAVLTERPTDRIKIVENNDYKIIRSANPVMYANENVVKVIYHFFILDTQNKIMEEFEESHFMRYLFKPELEMLLNKTGFTLLRTTEFLTDKELDYTTWSACFIAKKK